MATIWKGAISFGLVTIPVNLEPAVREASRISFRQLHGADLAPVRQERVCSRDGTPVAWGEIVKGYEYAPDRFVVVDEADLEAAAPARSKLLELEQFVALADIDARFFHTPYLLRPGAHGEKAYALLREALRETARVGLGKVTLRDRQHLVAVRPLGEALVAQFMRFAPDLVDVDAYAFPSATAVRPQELAMALQLVENLTEPFDAARFHDESTERLRAVIDAKLAGLDVPTEAVAAEPEGTRVIDLMSRLEESLSHVKRAGAKAPKAAAAPARRKPAAKAAAKARGARRRSA